MPLLYLAGLIVLSCLLGVTPAAFAQTAPNPCWTVGSNGWTTLCSTGTNPVTSVHGPNNLGPTSVGTGSCGPTGTSPDTCYVAASSTDPNRTSSCTAQNTAALAEAAPCDTIYHAMNQVRQGGGAGGHTSPDWVLLKAGDTFVNQSFKSTSGGDLSCGFGGISATQPAVITSYGTGARPIVLVNPLDGAGIEGNGCGGGGNNIAIVGIEFYAYTRDPSNPNYSSASPDIFGAYFLNPITWMLIEDCKFSFFITDIAVDGGQNASNNSNVSIRRNVVVDSYATDQHSQGIFVNATNNLLIQENLFDNNGWNATVPGAGATVFNHNMYLQYTNGPVTVIGNIDSNGADGDQFRSGGTITDNAFIRDPYGHNIGQPYSGLQTLVNNNVHIEQIDNTVNGGTALSIDTINTIASSGFNLGTATYSGNIVAHSSTPNTNGGGISIDAGQVDSVVENNIACNWKQGGGAPSGVLIWSQSSTTTLTGNYQDVADCDHNNYPSPDLTVGTYDASLGTGSCGGRTVGTTANFICKARQQSKANWNTALMADAFNTYIRAGFGITSSSSTSTPAVTTPSADTTPPSVPTGLAGTLASATQANLSWNASTDKVGVTGYNVYRNGSKVGTSTSTSYQDTSLAAGTTYTYAVSAYDAAGNTSAQSSSVSIATPAAPTVAISSPANGTTVLKNHGNLNIAASASDGSSSIGSISITADSTTLKTCTSTTSCSTTWSIKSISPGTHVISATATNTFGQKTSTSVTIVDLW
jgi:chitodextrinase